jgi:hypothetical protein
MALPFTVDAIDAVPEAQRSLYKESNGKFVLDVDGYEDPTNLKSALQKEREAAKTAAKQVQQWAALGKSPEEIQALVEAQAQAERDKLVKGGEWEKLKAQMTDAHKAELSKKDEAIAAREKALSKHLVDAAAVTALAAAKGSAALLLPHIRAAVKVVEEDGEYVVRVIDKTGSPRVNGKGDFLTIEDLVGEMRQSEEYGRAFDASGTTGGGAQGSGGASGAKTIKQAAFDALKPADRAKRMAEGYQVVP